MRRTQLELFLFFALQEYLQEQHNIKTSDFELWADEPEEPYGWRPAIVQKELNEKNDASLKGCVNTIWPTTIHYILTSYYR